MAMRPVKILLTVKLIISEFANVLAFSNTSKVIKPISLAFTSGRDVSVIIFFHKNKNAKKTWIWEGKNPPHEWRLHDIHWINSSVNQQRRISKTGERALRLTTRLTTLHRATDCNQATPQRIKRIQKNTKNYIKTMLFSLLLTVVQAQYNQASVNSAASGECKSILETQGNKINSLCFPTFNSSSGSGTSANKVDNVIGIYEKSIPSLSSPECVESLRQFISYTKMACASESVFTGGNITSTDFGNMLLISTKVSNVKTAGGKFCIIEQMKMASKLGIDVSQSVGAGASTLLNIAKSNDTKYNGAICTQCVKDQLAAVVGLGGLEGDFKAMISNLNNTQNGVCAQQKLAVDAGSNSFRSVLAPAAALVVILNLII
ncbi:hypothetical protein BC833DRAFT_564988 [Globomyces pollinis-pini]|nr:hypothetical protein BC833DRAFT_564988 [Globomyces pollinis-pini]